jgi:WD40 repeat protein
MPIANFAIERTITPPDSLLSLASSPDGRWIACTATDERVHVWDAASFEIAKAIRIGKRPKAIAFSSDSSLLAAGASTLVTFVTGTLKKGATVKGHRREVSRAAFSPDGTRIYGGGHSDVSPFDNSVRVWDLSTAQELARWEPSGSVCALCVSPDGATVAIATRSGQAMLLDAQTLTPRWEDPPEIRTSALRFTPSGRLLGTFSHALLFELDLGTGAERVLAPPLRFGTDLAISPDGTIAFVAVAHGGAAAGSLVAAVDVESGQVVATHDLGQAIPRAIALLPDSRVVVALEAPKALLVLTAT